MAGKYAPLENYLRGLPAAKRPRSRAKGADQKEVTLSFQQIEKILNSKLPASAYEDERWWQHETEATTSVRAHGPLPAGRSKAWMSRKRG